MPQLRFNEDEEWHDFAPEGRTGLKARPWFPLLYLTPGDRLSDHCVHRPKPLFRVQAKPARPPLHLLLLHLLTALVLVLQRLWTTSLLYRRKRRRGMTRAVASNDGLAVPHLAARLTHPVPVHHIESEALSI